MEFSKTLKNLREVKDITQDELARQLKVSRPTIAGYETKHRQPDFDKLLMISEFFQVSVDYLLTGKNPDSSTTIDIPPISEKTLDRKVMNSYKDLTIEEKQELLNYMQMLQLKAKYGIEDEE